MLNYTSHVLLVDDNAAEIYPLVEALRKFPFRLTVAGDGIQAYAQAVSTVPDIILMDVRMPRRDGITTTRLLKANPSTQHIPILFLAAAATLEDRLEGLRSGAVDYILKPFEAEEVVEKVRIHLSLKQRLLTPLVTSAVAQTRLQPRGSRAGRKNDSAAVLQRAAATIIQDRLADPPRISELAALLAVSERRVMAAFKASVGRSVFEYIRRERMHKAARLLAQTDLHMLDIVAEVGYSSAANFSTAFKQYWGKTPSAYRDGKMDVL
ncbi:two component transcriptional regulator, AraC family protein [Pusillimonas sp. T7-7]|uniref:response regulator n=1 Tax=Pusillimonas sp. (strain T7-7) TaxID=1007105 RepID=UPI0002084A22|nr:response regulator [Pusillimonas sp. T7-7]AEC21062.1 two component transcriptional regulator, AraC family protein [Pusillimonas sp. T7-7]